MKYCNFYKNTFKKLLRSLVNLKEHKCKLLCKGKPLIFAMWATFKLRSLQAGKSPLLRFFFSYVQTVGVTFLEQLPWPRVPGWLDL